MSDYVKCSQCQKPLKVPPEGQGKRIRCPHCQAVLDLSQHPAASGTETWKMRGDDGLVYGPVSLEELRKWANEGRLTPQTPVSRDGAATWQTAVTLFPDLASVQRPSGPNPYTEVASRYQTRYGDVGEQREYSDRSKIAAGLLGLFLGAYGVHRFYLGYPGIGLAMLLTCGGCGIWSFIDAILVFSGSVPDGDGLPLRD